MAFKGVSSRVSLNEMNVRGHGCNMPMLPHVGHVEASARTSQVHHYTTSRQVRVSGDRTAVITSGLARDILTEQQASIEGNPLEFLDVTEAYWKALKASKHEPHRRGPNVVRMAPEPHLDSIDYDVIVCGGTLGLMIGATLQRRGHKVAVVDKRLIQGRTQEWNISRGELQALVSVGLLTESELESCIASEFNPVRVGFAGAKEDIWVNDCLNLGVSPRKLLDLIKAKFVAAGGALFENHSFRTADIVPGEGARVSLMVHPAGSEGAAVGVGDVNRPNGLGGNSSNMQGPFTPYESSGRTPQPARKNSQRKRLDLGCRLLLDCMGHYSDIVKQMRGKAKPDGMCIVVGSCAEGFPTENNTFGDLLYTIDNAKDDMQMFWEAFPAEGGKARTTYMFAYSDAEPSRPSFEELLDMYFENIQKYQGISATDLRYKRVLFGGFPCWSNGPLKPRWDHIMQIGDASATQSPLSFGGFGAMLRHLPRLTEGLDDALRCGALSKEELAWMHPYQPALSASWLFQRSMSVGVGQLNHAQKRQAEQEGRRPPAPRAPPSILQLPLSHVNDVLACNFAVMKVLGDRVLRPFLQDTIQLVPLSLSMTGMMLANPIAISRVLLQVGPKTLLSWFGHYFCLLGYTILHVVGTPLRQLIRGNAHKGLLNGTTETERLQGITPSSDMGRSREFFKLRRAFDAWEYGSGSDYKYHPSHGPLQPPSNTMFAPSQKQLQDSLQPIQLAHSADATEQASPEPATVPVVVMQQSTRH